MFLKKNVFLLVSELVNEIFFYGKIHYLIQLKKSSDAHDNVH